MGLLDRMKRAAPSTTSAAPEPSSASEELPLTPASAGPGEQERERIAAALAALDVEGVDVDDLGSVDAGLDRALAAWEARQGDDHDAIVERYAIGIGEHLARRTDLAWAVVTDVFGTDLAVAAGDFVVVPHNLVAVRWMRRETGWVTPVVRHLVELRTR